MVVEVGAEAAAAEWVERVQAGEEVVLTRDGVVARVVPIERRRGTVAGQIWVSDGFDEPDPEIEAVLYGGDDE